ncbi:MAG: DNA-binding transcriptional regulator [Sumerlaeia bacterium]
MTDAAPVIVLDIANNDRFADVYRGRAFYGVIHYARRHTRWRLMFHGDCLSLSSRIFSFDNLSEMGVAGIVLATDNPAITNAAIESNTPTVKLLDLHPGEPFHAVVTDDVEVGRMGAQHFLERGFRYVAYAGHFGNAWDVRRFEGLKRAAEAAGAQVLEPFDYDPAPRLLGWHGKDAVTAERLLEWLDAVPKPLALMASDDRRALHLLEACETLGLAVPTDVAILGVDNNTIICESQLPTLSSVEPNPEAVGFQAAALLHQVLEGKTPDRAIRKVPPKGVVTRMSTEVTAVEDEAVQRALAYIGENLGTALSVDDIAHATGVSRRTLEQRFRHTVKDSINNSIRKQRLRKAKDLLRRTEWPLDEVAEACGFRRASYLSGIFSQETGLAPGAWRKLHRIEAGSGVGAR